MAKVYTTSTASTKVPVILSYTCPKCGRNVSENRSVMFTAQATVRGYNSVAAGQFAQQNLMASADKEIESTLKLLENGHLNWLLDQSGRNVSGKVICPFCGTRQILDMPENRQKLYTPAFPWIVTWLCFMIMLIVILAGSLSAAANGRTVIPPAVTVGAEVACVAALVAVIVVNRRKSKQAYADPALMEKRYHAVLNPHMQATMMVGLNYTRTVNIPGRS